MRLPNTLRLKVEIWLRVCVAFLVATSSFLVWHDVIQPPQPTAAQPRSNAPLFVRGYIAVTTGGNVDVPRNLARLPAHDVYVPDVKVFLRDLATGTDGASVQTDLSGRFTLRPHNPNPNIPNPGRYRVCWTAPGFIDGCSKDIYSVSTKPLHVSKVRIDPDRRYRTTVVFGTVKMKDGSQPRMLDPLANVNAFATVHLLDKNGTILARAFVNNFGEYVLPRVPVRQEIRLRTAIEGSQDEQRILPEANLDRAPFHPIHLLISNTPPRLEEIVPFDANGRRVKVGKPGDKVQLKARGADRDGDPLQFKWLISSGSGTLTMTNSAATEWKLPNAPGRYSVKVIAWDKKGGYATATQSLRVNTLGIPFTGRVAGTDTPVISGAEVEVNGRKTFTGAEGYFSINVRDAKRFVLSIRKAGYGLVSRVYDDAVTGGQWIMTKATVERVDPTRKIDITDRRDKRNCPGSLASRLDWRKYYPLAQPQWQDGKGNVVQSFVKLELPLPSSSERPGDCGPGVQIQIPANALRDERKRAPTGPVDISVATVDLRSPGQMPGDYTVRLASGATRVMQSYGAASIDITSGSRRFNLRPGTYAKLTLPVDPSQIAAGGPLPPTIPLLTYNERDGVWLEQGTATLVGNAYVANVKHFSTINVDLVKTNQSCVRVKSPTLPASYKLEYTIPVGGGAAPIVRLVDIDNSSPSEHVIYNLPSNTNIVLVPIRESNNIPFGTFVVNTGATQAPTTPNLPVGPPYSACSTEVILTDLGIPDEPIAGEFLHGLYSFEATNLDELDPNDPSDVALAAALDQATTNYYAQIDPRGKRLTLSDFKSTNGFPTGEINVRFANSGDLGFGRDMHCTQKANPNIGGFDVACYVTNYGDITTPDTDDAIAAVAGVSPVATVAMEYSQIESAPGNQTEFDDPSRVVKFYVYNAAGTQLLKAANLDAKGARPIPQLCMVCHNGEYPSGPVTGGEPPFNDRDDVKLNSRFLPFDLHYYTFAPAPNDKATQQPAFKQLNETIVQNTPPDATHIADIITQMYASGPTQDEDFIVAGWNAQPIEQGMYRDVVGRTCRTCHAANLFPTLQFDQASQAKDLLGSIESRVCTEHVMPHAKVPHEIFWLSTGPHMPAQLQVFGDTFKTALNGWNGTLCGSFTPGGSTPVAFYTSTIQPIWNGGPNTVACTSCHIGASPQAGLNLSAASSYGNLFNVDSTQLPSMKRVKPGDAANSYLFHKISGTQNTVGGSGSQMPPVGATLTPATRAAIENWINSGAPGP